MHQIQHQKCKRPLIIVPKAVYSKWVHDINELFPNINLIKLENLNKEIIDNLRINSIFEESNKGFLLPEKSVSICTAEAIEKIYFKEETLPLLQESFNHILSQKKNHFIF